MNLEQITAELLAFPISDRAKLAKTLADSVDDFVDGRIEKSWGTLVSKRVKESNIEGFKAIDSAKVHEEAQKRLNEVRKVSSTCE